MLNEILFFIVLFVTNTIQTITGFAGTMLAMPLSIQLIGAENARNVLNIFSLIACFFVAFPNRHSINYKELTKMCSVMIGGIIIGMLIFTNIDLQILLYIYGVVIIFVALWKMIKKSDQHFNKTAKLVILISAGLIHGIFLSGGAFLVLYCADVFKEKDIFRATIASVWVILQSIMLIISILMGQFSFRTVKLTGISVIPLLISVIVGNYLYKRISQKIFLYITYVLLMITGISLLIC